MIYLHCLPVYNLNQACPSFNCFAIDFSLPLDTQRVKNGERGRGAINSEALSALFTLSTRSQTLARLWEHIDVNGTDNGQRAAKAVRGHRRGGDVDPDGGGLGDAPIRLQLHRQH